LVARYTLADVQLQVVQLVGSEYTVSGTYETSRSKLTFKHDACGHETTMTWSQFKDGRRCYYCNPRYWDDEKFKAYVTTETHGEYQVLTPYTKGTNPVTLKHLVCGKTYETRATNFITGARCPYCGGTLKLTHTEFVNRVKSLVGDEYTMLSHYVNMMSNIRMRHNLCGTEFIMHAQNFIDGSRCPQCSELHRPTPDEFRQVIADLVGDDYTVLGDYVKATEPIKMRHNKCNREFMVEPCAFKNGSRCPRCRESKGERAIYDYLTEHEIMFEQQWQIHIAGRKAPLRADFYLEQQNLVIEFDGIQHYQAVDFFGGEKALRDNQERDRLKDEWCKAHHIDVWRIRYDQKDRLTNLLEARLVSGK
jgi:Uncharacterized protein conserved in bacteria